MLRLCSFYLGLLLVISSCTPISMKNTFPFKVYARSEAFVVRPQEQYNFDIIAPVGELDGYGDLFEEYSYGGNGHSWAEHIRAILHEKDPALLDQLFFNEEGDTFLVHVTNQAAVNRFLLCIMPVFGSMESLEQYFKHTDPEDFIE